MSDQGPTIPGESPSLMPMPSLPPSGITAIPTPSLINLLEIFERNLELEIMQTDKEAAETERLVEQIQILINQILL